jgi:hypothetical protein
VDEIPEAMVIALLRAGRGRHAADHRPFAYAAQLLKNNARRPSGVASVGVTPIRAKKSKMSVGTALLDFKSGTRSNDRARVMRAVAGRLTDDEIRAVAQYLAGL